MTVIEPSDWLQAAVTAERRRGKQQQSPNEPPMRTRAPPHAELRPDVPHLAPLDHPPLIAQIPPVIAPSINRQA